MSKRERIEALEARVAALEASNSPGGLGDVPDNTPGGEVCEAVCRACQGSGYADPDEAMPSGCFDCDSTTCRCADPEPVPQWRASVDAARRFLTGEDPLVTVLRSLACVADDSKVTDANLARIVAVCEGQVGDGWKADPEGIVLERCVQWLLGPLSRNDWRVFGNRAAAWLRSLTEDEQ